MNTYIKYKLVSNKKNIFPTGWDTKCQNQKVLFTISVLKKSFYYYSKITITFQWPKFPVYFLSFTKLSMTRVIDLFLVKFIN